MVVSMSQHNLAIVRVLGQPSGSGLSGSSVHRLRLLGSHLPLVGPFDGLVVGVSSSPGLVLGAERGLPEGAGRAEAVAVRLRRSGVAVQLDTDPVSGPADLERRCRDHGRSSVAMVRADPSLLSELQVGSWFRARWQVRLARRLACRMPLAVRALHRAAPGTWSARLLADAAFWAGVRVEASAAEWHRFTRGSYVALCYHRVAGDNKPGQERLDVPPPTFERQLRVLRRLRFRPLSADEWLRFHALSTARLPPRSYTLTFDDGFLDAVEAARRHPTHHPEVFVPTAAVGRSLEWAPEDALADWQDLWSAARAGIAVGSHGRHHRPLAGLEAVALRDEVAGSLEDLRARLDRVLPVLAYPNGRHDHAARAAALAAGYQAAFTTEIGRNGAGTDVLCLRRISVKAWDTPLALVWKVLTGELLPRGWERRLRRRHERRLARGQGRSGTGRESRDQPVRRSRASR
jgi:peptidoglycan/xylan/chitin deacetylase (PgdA/CDA1 family)